jgi:hypothetical protein
VFGYLVSYALIFEQAPLVRRVRSLVPYAGVFLILLAARVAGHYGVYGLGAFVDPLREPGAFLAVLPARVLVLFTSQLSRLSADLYQLARPDLQPLYLGTGVLVCGLFAFCAWPSVRRRRELRFLAAGAACSALPLAAAAPSDRLLTFVGLGVMPLLASMLRGALDALAGGAQSTLATRARGAFAVMFALVHLALDPLLLPAIALWPGMTERALETVDASVPRDTALASRAIIVTEVPDSLLVSYLPFMRAYKGETPIGKLYWLVGNTTPARFERRGANRLRVSTEGGFFSDAWNERNSRFPLHAGEHIGLSEMTVTIVKVTPDGRPLVCDFDFAHPLEAERYLWLSFRGGRLIPARPPAMPGASVLISTAGG